jgi:deazaflavin-dependent oxidoreductase (nitroreductase family)
MPQDWYNPIVKFLLRSPLHSAMSGSTLLITYTGRKSGKQYTLPVSYIRKDNTLTCITSRSRIWWRNLRGEATVELLLQRQVHKAVGEVLEDPEEVVEGLRAYLLQAPHLARFFKIAFDEEGKPDQRDLEREAEDLVLVKLHLSHAGASG